MEQLNSQQVAKLYDRLILEGASDAQVRLHIEELAGEVEHFMWIGLPFDSALDKVMLETNIGSLHNLHPAHQREMAFSDAQLQEASLDDIVFQFRNKAYGAYDLRQNYGRILRNSFIMALGVCLMGMALLQMISRGAWSYMSMWGLIWLVGLGAVAYSGINLYLQREREREELRQ